MRGEKTKGSEEGTEKRPTAGLPPALTSAVSFAFSRSRPPDANSRGHRPELRGPGEGCGPDADEKVVSSHLMLRLATANRC